MKSLLSAGCRFSLAEGAVELMQDQMQIGGPQIVEIEATSAVSE